MFIKFLLGIIHTSFLRYVCRLLRSDIKEELEVRNFTPLPDNDAVGVLDYEAFAPLVVAPGVLLLALLPNGRNIGLPKFSQSLGLLR